MTDQMAPGGDRSPRDTLSGMLMGAWISQAISTVARLNIPGVIQQHGPLTAAEIVGRHNVAAHPDLLLRVMRACASAGVFSEDAEGRFGSTPLSEVLTEGHPGSLKSFAELYGGRWWAPCGLLLDVVRDGQAAPDATSSFASGGAQRIEQFARAMRSNLAFVPALLEHPAMPRARTLVDVGGGFGHMSLGLLNQLPHLRAFVIDLPEVVAGAARAAERENPALLKRLTFVGGDILADVPAGDTYLISRVLHDWDDASCVRVLENCRQRMLTGGTVICVDAVLPALGDASGRSAKFLDLLMMVTLPGRERSESDWRGLFDKAGLRFVSATIADERSLVAIIEAVPR